MAIIGIERLIYCVDDVVLSARFLEDFGLAVYERATDLVRFQLPDNSRVYVRAAATRPVSGSEIVGQGVHEIVWGVDTIENFERLVANVATDRKVTRDTEGVAHFVADGGIAMGLRHWPEKRLVFAPTDPVNSPGNIRRMNAHRRWITRARPKGISHVGILSPDIEACFRFLESRLNFRLSDRQRDFGLYCRADGVLDHHNIALLNAAGGLPGTDGRLRFHHVNYMVTDLDEMMAGKNYLERRGWPKSEMGIGRHRIASALFCYFPCPAGGEAEYGADADALDDNWVPRDFSPLFGLAHWIHDMPAWWVQGPDWDVTFAEGAAPFAGSVIPHSGLLVPSDTGGQPTQETSVTPE